MTGLTTDLECVIFNQGNPLMIFVTIYTIHQNKSFLFHFSVYRVILCSKFGAYITSSELTRKISHSHMHALNKTKPCYTCIKG